VPPREIAELRAATDQWLRVYNRERPHDSLRPAVALSEANLRVSETITALLRQLPTPSSSKS